MAEQSLLLFSGFSLQGRPQVEWYIPRRCHVSGSMGPVLLVGLVVSGLGARRRSPRPADGRDHGAVPGRLSNAEGQPVADGAHDLQFTIAVGRVVAAVGRDTDSVAVRVRPSPVLGSLRPFEDSADR
jgi:hypothetical protein